MANFKIEIENDSNEDTRVFGNADSAIEYCKSRVHENFTVSVSGSYAYQDVVNKTKQQLIKNLTNAKVK